MPRPGVRGVARSAVTPSGGDLDRVQVQRTRELRARDAHDLVGVELRSDVRGRCPRCAARARALPTAPTPTAAGRARARPRRRPPAAGRAPPSRTHAWPSVAATASTPITRSSAIIGIHAPLCAPTCSTRRWLTSVELPTSYTVTGAASNTALAIPEGSLRRSMPGRAHHPPARRSTRRRHPCLGRCPGSRRRRRRTRRRAAT